MGEPQQLSELRIDRWLWAARFYKQRSLATEAVLGGHVQVNGQRVKPAKGVRVGDTVTVRKGTAEFIVEILGLSERRGGAPEAALLYREEEASRIKRLEASALAKMAAISAPRPEKRPDKKARRQIIQFNP